MQLYLEDHLKKYFSAEKPLFDQVMALRGESFRHQDGRLTQRVVIGDKPYFIKQHSGVGWREIFKNIIQLRWPIISAKNEWRAIQKLQSLGVAAPKIAGFGKRGWNPARLQSFILMEELTPIISLEDLCRDWPSTQPQFIFKQALIKAVANAARVLHQNGINHRDFYICHFLLETDSKSQVSPLYLIDLHRAQIRSKTPKRWVVKDLAALFFSAANIGLTNNDLYRFMKIYSNKSLYDIFKQERTFWEKVKLRGTTYCDRTKRQRAK